MAEFRYQGIGLSGRMIQGIISANNKRDANRRAEEIAQSRRFKLRNLNRKATFLYKVRKGREAAISGQQKAFSSDEVRRALEKMGYTVVTIQKKLIDLKLKPPTKDVVMFIRLSADLLREKLPYDEILNLLSNDMDNKSLKQTLKEIHQDLKDGKDGVEVFGKQADAIGKFPAHMLGVASKSGNMVEIYEATAKVLERNEEFKKNLKSALIMPSVVVLALLGAVLFYVAYIFPETANMFLKFDIELPPMTAATLQMSEWLQDKALLILGTIVGAGIFLGRFFTTQKGRFFLSRYLIKVPVIGTLMHKTSIEIWCRVFYSLYSGSGENVEAIRVAAEACRSPYMEHRIKAVALPLMLKEGQGLVEALEKTGVFTKNALSRLHSGAETGTIRETALQVANYYEKETTHKLRNIIDLIQVFIAMAIMIVMTAITIISSETAVIKPKMPGVG
ncbi:type II secretion system protein [candidate division LCP-89 bacterium B3_LCP]|uniref:Type II secretion system protein n=1 Tax=candidate division LCP-89 bacterium B3_LCP TaxID=2012998 RepID=A0A532UXV4_UNCL8|nr:MAG: type II secretion system protein [candidate division LCP-89 bacterium B3_LCP]